MSSWWVWLYRQQALFNVLVAYSMYNPVSCMCMQLAHACHGAKSVLMYKQVLLILELAWTVIVMSIAQFVLRYLLLGRNLL